MAALDALNQYNLPAPALSPSLRAIHYEKHYIKGKYYCWDAVTKRVHTHKTHGWLHTKQQPQIAQSLPSKNSLHISAHGELLTRKLVELTVLYGCIVAVSYPRCDQY